MKKIADLSAAELSARLADGTLRLRTGPAVMAVQSHVPAVRAGIALHYADHEAPDASAFADFHIAVERPHGLRRWLQPQVVFRFDGESPFTPLPGNQGFPMLEWGMNWCISSHLHRFFIVHAAVVERGGRALILPAPPGSGKSTLCAGLVWRGWRLLSDELALIDPQSGLVVPVPRPVSLKNASIDVIRRFAPQAVFGPMVSETVKGDVAHFKPPPDSVRRAAEPARPAWIVNPRYVKDAPAALVPTTRPRALVSLVENAFNAHVHGASGFDALAAVVEHCQGYDFHYGRLDDAAATFDALAAA